jgi:hypothetical protein
MAKLADPSSVARPSEVEAFKKGLLQANMASMTNDTALTILKNFRAEVNKRADNAYKIRGIENPNKATQVNPQGNDVINGLQLPLEDDDEAYQAREKRIMELKAKAGK